MTGVSSRDEEVSLTGHGLGQLALGSGPVKLNSSSQLETSVMFWYKPCK